MAESVYKVIEIVGASDQSWEKAAAAAVARAGETIRTLDEKIEGPALVLADDVWFTHQALKLFLRLAKRRAAPVATTAAAHSAKSTTAPTWRSSPKTNWSERGK